MSEITRPKTDTELRAIFHKVYDIFVQNKLRNDEVLLMAAWIQINAISGEIEDRCKTFLLKHFR